MLEEQELLWSSLIIVYVVFPCHVQLSPILDTCPFGWHHASRHSLGDWNRTQLFQLLSPSALYTSTFGLLFSLSAVTSLPPEYDSQFNIIKVFFSTFSLLTHFPELPFLTAQRILISNNVLTELCYFSQAERQSLKY